jgi:histidinol-phosphatase (PHP family)
MNPDIAAYELGTIDTHVHSRHSCDSGMEPIDAVQAARDKGLRAMVFTEHVDFDPTDEGFGFYDAEAIRKSLDEFQIPDSGFSVYRGVEITYQPQYERTIREFIAAGRFDFVIGSIHMIGSDDISRPERQDLYYAPRTEQEAYGAYFGEVQKLVDSRLFDCLGHFDLCKRHGCQHYGPMDWTKYRAQVQGIIRAVVQTGIYLELNTSGLRQAPREPYPAIDVIREYRNLGGKKLTLGSDAHFPEHVGYSFPEICGMLNTEYRIQNTE